MWAIAMVIIIIHFIIISSFLQLSKQNIPRERLPQAVNYMVTPTIQFFVF